MAKRVFDVLCAAVALIALAPVMAWISFLILKEEGVPVFYRGERVGLHGKPFKMVKFRTMAMNADRMGGPSTADDDPRVTKVGRLLRKYKLDELPQLINVLRGDMSLVGPRPEVPQYVAFFSADERAILSVRPGITDWASIWNADEGKILKGSEDPERTYLEEIRPEKIRLQLKYVREHSFVVDLKILWATAAEVLRKR